MAAAPSRSLVLSESIERALTGALTSVLSKLDQKENDENGAVTTPKTTGKRKHSAASLPSAFVNKRAKKGPAAISKMFTYDRDIICLPNSYANSGSIAIPRSPVIREYLAKNGLIGKIRLSSAMDEDEIFKEMRSVFRAPMGGDTLFELKVLQPAGGTSKSLAVPSLSSSFEWTVSGICGKNSKVPIYILAVDELQIMESGTESGSELPVIPISTKLTKPVKQCVEDAAQSGSVTKPSCKESKKAKDKSRGKERMTASCAYSTFIDLVTDDEDFSDSPSPPPLSPLTPQAEFPGLPVSSILQAHRNAVLSTEHDTTRIMVRRKHLYQDTLHKFRSGVKLNQQLKIVFVGESAVDSGGPLKEFLHLLMSSIAQNNNLLCGIETLRAPRHNLIELEKRSFYFVGVAIAMSLLHGGPAPQFFTPAIADYLVYGIQNVKATPEDVPDVDIKQNLIKIQNADSSEELSQLLDSGDYYSLGIAQNIKLEGKYQFVATVAKHYAILAVKAELDQILCGLSSTFDMLNVVRRNGMRSLFVHKKEAPLTAEMIYTLFPPVFSAVGSNRREEEEAVVMQWAHYTESIENCGGTVEIVGPDGNKQQYQITLNDIVAFATGAYAVPPVGFDPHPAIEFHMSSKYPRANTCANTLLLPLKCESFDTFVYNFTFGVLNAAGFGQV